MFSILVLTSCNKEKKRVPQTKDTLPVHDTIFTNKKHLSISPRKYFNKRFREVTVEKIATNEFRIKGEGQIFEANFNSVSYTHLTLPTTPYV